MPRAHALAVQLEADVTLAEHGLVERTDDVDLEQLNVIGRVRLRQELFELPHRGVDVRKGSADQAAVRRLQHRDVLERPELGLVDAQLDQGRARWPEHRQVQPRGVRAAAAIRCPHHCENTKRALSFTLASKDIAPVYHARAYGGPDPVERGPFLFKNIRKSVVPGTRGARGQPLRNLRRNSPTPARWRRVPHAPPGPRDDPSCLIGNSTSALSGLVGDEDEGRVGRVMREAVLA